jgi:hypothetical protein
MTSPVRRPSMEFVIARFLSSVLPRRQHWLHEGGEPLNDAMTRANAVASVGNSRGRTMLMAEG